MIEGNTSCLEFMKAANAFSSPAVQVSCGFTSHRQANKPRPRSSLRQIIFSLGQSAISTIFIASLALSLSATTLLSRCMSRLMKSITSACPAPPIHYQHYRVQTTKTSVHGGSICWGWRSASSAVFSKSLPARLMENQWFIPKSKTIGGMLILLVPVLLRRGSAAPKHDLRLSPPAWLDVKVDDLQYLRSENDQADGRVVSNFVMRSFGTIPSPSTAQANRHALSVMLITLLKG